VSRLSDHHFRFAAPCSTRSLRGGVSPGFAVDLDIGDRTVYTRGAAADLADLAAER
jgi:hypothetical protein